MILLAVLILFVTPLGILILRLVLRMRSLDQGTTFEQQMDDLATTLPVRRTAIFRSSPVAYYWLAALIGSLAAWLLVLLSRPRQPYTLVLAQWRPITYFPNSPVILVDPISWSFALALTTLVLVVILTSPIRLQGVDWHAWASSLALVGFGLFAVLAGNPLTLMLAWAAIDILEIAILLVQVQDSKVHGQALGVFAARVGGLGVLLWADITSRTGGNLWAVSADGSAGAVPSRLSLILLIAAGLRLGVLPLRLPYLQEPPLRRGLGTTLRLVPAAASLILLTRTAYVGVPVSWAIYLLVLIGLTALYGAYLWVSAADELSGRPYWILSMTAFAVASAVCGLPGASLAWGLACIFSGGMLFLFSARHRYLLPLPVFGLLGFLGLPFTPAWGGMQLYTSRTVLYVLPLFVLAHALLVLGYVHHAVRPEPLPGQSQRWVGLLYPLGLALFPVIQFTWLWQAMHWPSVLRLSIASPDTTHLPLLTWMGGALALGLAVLFLWISHRRHPNPPRWLSSIGPQILSLRWFYNFLEIAFHISIRLVGFLTGLLEGDGGILWVLVLLALLVVLLLHGGRL